MMMKNWPLRKTKKVLRMIYILTPYIPPHPLAVPDANPHCALKYTVVVVVRSNVNVGADNPHVVELRVGLTANKDASGSVTLAELIQV
jgi:mannitol/fructose-specific phosphotransferase system IIA component (Ntr-type)